jgi:hypothetical protein
MTVLWLIICNVLLSVLVLVWDLLRGKGAYSLVHFCIMLFCPVVGPLYFLGEFIFALVFTKQKELAYRDISFDSTRHDKKIKGVFLEEVDILPLDEAFSISNKKDRRRALLTTIKRDFEANIPSVRRGINNDDSETSHYAASLILTLNTRYLNLLQKARLEHERTENQPQAARHYLDVLSEYLRSNIIDEVDSEKYVKIFVDTLSWLFANYADVVAQEDYVFVISLLIDYKQYEKAAMWIARGLRAFPESDMIHYLQMKMFYAMRDKVRFLTALNNIMSSNINISNKTLQLIRFFTYKQANAISQGSQATNPEKH